MRTFQITPGTSIETACDMAWLKVSGDGEPLSFEFNGVTTEVHEGMTVDDIMEKAFQGKLKLERYRKEKFEFDLRHALIGGIDPGDMVSEETIEAMLSAIRPFLRTP